MKFDVDHDGEMVDNKGNKENNREKEYR